MDKFVKFLILSLLLVVLFFRDSFPSELIYWLTYGFIGSLIVVLWFTMFWVSRRKAVQVTGAEPDFDIFCARVPLDVQEDLSRGRMCFCDGKMMLVKKENGSFKINWETDISSIKSIGFGKVAKVRRGFTIYTVDGNATEFTCGKINRYRKELYRALGWDIKGEENA